jgi:hypothetical protein
MLNAVRLRPGSGAAAIPGNFGSRRLLLLSIRTHGARRKQNGVSAGRFLVRLHRAKSDCILGPKSARSIPKRNQIFDSEVELC